MAVAFRTRDASVSGWAAYDDSDVDESLWAMVSLVCSSMTDMDRCVGRRCESIFLDELTLNGERRDDALANSRAWRKATRINANPTEFIYPTS